MAEPGSTTPVQPIRGGGGRGAAGIAVVLVAGVGLLAWQPWASGAGPSAAPGHQTASSSVTAGSESTAGTTGRPGASDVPGRADAPSSSSSDLLAVPTVGPWSGRVAAEWSTVAFLRADPVSRDPLDLDQQLVAVFIGPVREPVGGPDAVCDATGTTLHPSAAAALPTREVRFLGIAFPADREVDVERVVRVGGDASLGALAVAIGRIPGEGAGLGYGASAPRHPGSAARPVTTPSGCSGCREAGRGRTASTALTCSPGTGRRRSSTPASGPERRPRPARRSFLHQVNERALRGARGGPLVHWVNQTDL
jgi:hypothetical protein